MGGMNYLKTSFVLVGVAVAGNLLVLFAPLSPFWKGIVNTFVLVVVVAATVFTVLDIRKTRREEKDDLR